MQSQPDAILELIELLKERRQRGLETYGVPVDPDAQACEWWLREAIAEKADDLIYGFAALKTLQKLRLRNTELEEGRVRDQQRIKELEAKLEGYMNSWD